MRLGLFGGSFDPVHNGHLALARACRDQLGLDEVWLIPAAVQPFKQSGPQASNEDRLEMLRLAAHAVDGLLVSDIEIARGGVSYTVDTLREVAELHPQAELYLLMGADTLADLPNWREPEEVLRLATPAVVCRPGESIPDKPVARIVEMKPTNISSTEIRRRIAAGGAIDGMTPKPVAAFLNRNKVYRDQSGSLGAD